MIGTCTCPDPKPLPLTNPASCYGCGKHLPPIEEKGGNITDDERAFALRRWRTLIREIHEMQERYGFKTNV